MKKIGIFGGTFDPPHLGHLAVARAALQQFDLCEIRFMTGGVPPHKQGSEITSPRQRFEMTRLAVENENKLIADNYEINKKTYSYTAETLIELKGKNKNWEIYFIIGEDSLLNFNSWYMPEVIAENCILAVYPRGRNSNLKELIDIRKTEFNADIRLIEAETVEISSTMIRKGIKSGECMSDFLPKRVAEYIKHNGLYV